MDRTVAVFLRFGWVHIRRFNGFCAVWNDCRGTFAPGKPAQTGHIKAANGRLCGECLNANWFLDLRNARRKIASWARRLQRYSREKRLKRIANLLCLFWTSNSCLMAPMHNSAALFSKNLGQSAALRRPETARVS